MPDKYEKWIKEEVVYIITPKEKEVFYKLENDKQRDKFIEEFWRQRDPIPGTPRNELKEEHYRRIEYANKKFGKSKHTKGWRTDMGRIYIMLGEPVHIQKYLTGDTHPIEIWYYHGNPKLGQPPTFRLLFFQKYGAGEYRLYDPMADGPKSLVPFYSREPEFRKDVREEEEMKLIAQKVGPEDLYAYRILKENVGLELAEASFSNFPGRSGPDHRLPSATLIHQVDTYPHKKVRDDYAYEFLEHKAVVEVSYSVYYIGNQSKVSVIQDPSGFFFVNYSIIPEILSVDLYKDKYFTNFKTTIRVTNKEGKTIFQQERNVPIELRKEELEIIGQRPFHLCDSFPLISGNYIFHLLLENTVTKEFTSFEKNIYVPEAKYLQMSSLILARKVNRDSLYSQANRAFQIGNLQIYPSLRNIFFKEDTLFLFFQIYGLSQELKEEGILEFVFFKGEQLFQTTRKKVNEYENGRDFLQEFSMEKFLPGRYMVKVSLLDSVGRELLSEKEELSVSSKPLPGSWIVSQANPPLNDPLYPFLLGNQFLNKGEVREAHDELAKAYERDPDSLDYALSYAKALLILKEFQKAKEILLPFIEAKRENFTLYYYLGKVSQETGELDEAISYYQKALSHKGNVVEILNSIGECYIRLGDKEQALRILLKSLEINPNQEKVKKIIEDLKRRNPQ
ncbi:MAG: GWxTD domain-containing protein [Candidatus Aminicenantaceae bacterium]